MSYRARRHIGNAAAAVAAAGLTAAGAWALGGHAPSIDTAGSSSRRAAPRTRTVVRDVQVKRVVHLAAEPLAAPQPVAGAPSAGGTITPAADPHGARRDHTAPARHPGGPRPARTAPQAEGTPASAGGGYRAFAAATAALSGDLVMARSGAGVALDGHPLDVTDELGSLVGDLPAGRTAFGRALSLPGDAAATSSSPPAGPAANQDGGRGSSVTTTARTDDHGSCLTGPISSAEARAASATAGALGLAGGHSRTDSQLDDTGSRHALVSRATVTPPEVSIAPGTPAEISVRFLGPVTLLARAGGTPGSAGVQMGPRGDDAGAPLVEIVAGSRTTRFTAADVLEGGGRTLRLGAATVVLGGAPHAWRREPDAPPLIGADGTFASAAADVLTVRAGDAPAVVLGHLEASAVVPERGVLCPS